MWKNVVPCEEGGQLHPSQKNNKWGENTFCNSSYFNTKKHGRAPGVFVKNSLPVVSNIKQRLPWPPNLQISHLHIQIFDWTQDEWDSLSRKTIRLRINSWFSASPSSCRETEATSFIFLKCTIIVLSYVQQGERKCHGSSQTGDTGWKSQMEEVEILQLE